MSLSILAFAADPRTLLPEVQEIIVKKTWHGEMVQNVEYTLLKWLAYVVDYISEAVDQVLNFNLYNVIKDVFNIDTIIYPIAWALAGMTVVLIGILIIVNADKIHITDYVRNILTSLFSLSHCRYSFHHLVTLKLSVCSLQRIIQQKILQQIGR